jgi:hypothetical protein
MCAPYTQAMSNWADFTETTVLPHIAWCLREHGYDVEEGQDHPDRLVVRHDDEQVATVEHRRAPAR